MPDELIVYVRDETPERVQLIEVASINGILPGLALDADGGLTIANPVRITIKNTTTGQEQTM